MLDSSARQKPRPRSLLFIGRLCWRRCMVAMIECALGQFCAGFIDNMACSYCAFQNQCPVCAHSRVLSPCIPWQRLADAIGWRKISCVKRSFVEVTGPRQNIHNTLLDNRAAGRFVACFQPPYSSFMHINLNISPDIFLSKGYLVCVRIVW